MSRSFDRFFRSQELAEQKDKYNKRRQMRRAAYFDLGAQSMLGVLDDNGVHSQSEDSADRAYRLANQMLSGRGQ